MAITYNSKIVLDKLVFHVDAANEKCNPSATTVTNMTAYEYDGTKDGTGIGYSSNGYWTFDGVSSNINFPDSNIAKDPSLYLGDTTGNLTYEIWANRQGAMNETGEMRLMSTDASDYTALVLISDSTYAFRWYTNGADGTDITTTTPTVMNTNEWFHVVGTHSWDGSTAYEALYINGELEVDQTKTLASPPYGVGTSRQFAIGSNTESADDPNNDTFNGYISVVRIYGKALTAAEVKRNFNAQRGRYGI